MITCATAINSGIWFHQHTLPCRSVSYSGFTSASRKHFPSTSTHYPIEKEAGRIQVHAVTAKVETQNLNKTDALASTLESASSGRKNPKRLSTSASQIIKADHFPVVRYPLGTESAIKAIAECNTLVFVVDKHANKKVIKEHVNKMFKVRAQKVNTAIMPDGTKKAYIMLPPQFKASDVAKKIKIF